MSTLLQVAALLAAVTTSPAQAPMAQGADVAPGAGASREAELNLIALPTTRSMKRYGTYFRLTHRFTRDLRFGTFGDLLGDLFGLDAGAIMGLEFRFAPTSNLHVAAHRTNLFKDLQLSGRYDAWRQEGLRPFALSVTASIEGDDNMRDHHQPAFGLVLSRSLGDAAVVYVSPNAVWNTPTAETGHEEHDHEHGFETAPVETADEDYTVFTGLGFRARVRPSVYLVAEYSPRLAGYAPDRGAWGVGIEKHTRGHMFQLNVTNSFATTFGQIARGGDRRNVYLGFNLARRF
jgi:hypothetical protein